MKKELEKKKREKKRKVEEENEDSSSEMDMEVSTVKERQENKGQSAGNENMEKDKEQQIWRKKEQENNNNNKMQDREVYKRARIVMRDGRMLYEDLVVNEGENKIIQETCYKSSHKGEVIVQAKIKDKYKTKVRHII